MSEYSGESGRRASAQPIIDAIGQMLERVGLTSHDDSERDPRSLKWDNPRHRELVRKKFEDNADGLSAYEQEAILPGFGPEGRGGHATDTCGNPHPFLCTDCANTVSFGRTCSKSVCARCGVAWVRDAAIKKSAKIRRVRKEKHQATRENEHQKEHHLILSAPLGWYYDLATAGLTMPEAQERTKELVTEILEELRAQGVLVRHSYRGENEDDGSIKTETDDRGAWKQRLNSDRRWWNDVRDELAWMPHYHAIVVSDFIKGGELSETVERETGWVMHRIADEDGISLPNDGAMARALTYCLSHADIRVNADANGNNRSSVWEKGIFRDDRVRSSSRFKARPHDLDWADATVRKVAQRTLGLQSGTTDCGASLPAVDDPDELARRIINEVWPHDDALEVEPDTILWHVSEGNIRVSTSTSSGSGGTLTIRDADGNSLTDTAGQLPTAPNDPFVRDVDVDVSDRTATDDHNDDCECCDDRDDRDDRDEQHDLDEDDDRCDGTLIPIEEARQRGLLDDDDWLQQAPYSDDALEADRQHPEDGELFGLGPGKAVGAG
jgi:hypothetical protein